MQSKPLFQLKLNGHCIQTAAQAAYQEKLHDILNSNTDPTLLECEEIEYIRVFLERTDFQQVRKHFPRLDGRESLIVSVEKQREGDTLFRIIEK